MYCLFIFIYFSVIFCSSFGALSLVFALSLPPFLWYPFGAQRIATHLYVSSAGGNLRRASISRDVRKANGPAHGSAEGKGHLQEDGLEQITFTSKVPLSLARCAPTLR